MQDKRLGDAAAAWLCTGGGLSFGARHNGSMISATITYSMSHDRQLSGLLRGLLAWPAVAVESMRYSGLWESD